MELEESLVLHSRKEECVDARYVLIKLLSERLTDEQISDLSGLTRQAVNKIRNGWDSRCRWYVRSCYKNIKSAINTQ